MSGFGPPYAIETTSAAPYFFSLTECLLCVAGNNVLCSPSPPSLFAWGLAHGDIAEYGSSIGACPLEGFIRTPCFRHLLLATILEGLPMDRHLQVLTLPERNQNFLTVTGLPPH